MNRLTAREALRMLGRDLVHVPLVASRIMARRGHVLLMVAALSTAGHELLLQRATAQAEKHPMLSLVTLAASVVVTVFGFALMFVIVRGLLRTRTSLARGDRQVRNLVVRDEGFLGAAFAVALPFLVFYGAWGLFRLDVSELVARTVVGEGFANPLDVATRTLLLAAAGAFLARAAFDRIWRRWRFAPWAFGSAVFEAGWLVFAFALAERRMPEVREWVATRRGTAWLDGLRDALVERLRALTGPLARAAEWLADAFASLGAVLNPVKYGVVEPALWLTIAAIACGCELDRDRIAARLGDTRLFERARAGTPRVVRSSASVLAQEVQEKYVPLLNGGRIVIAGGVMPFLVCALWYDAARFVEAHAQRAALSHARELRPLEVGEVIGYAADELVLSIFMVVRVAILAAGLELLLRRLIARIEVLRAAPAPSTGSA